MVYPLSRSGGSIQHLTTVSSYELHKPPIPCSARIGANAVSLTPFATRYALIPLCPLHFRLRFLMCLPKHSTSHCTALASSFCLSPSFSCYLHLSFSTSVFILLFDFTPTPCTLNSMAFHLSNSLAVALLHLYHSLAFRLHTPLQFAYCSTSLCSRFRLFISRPSYDFEFLFSAPLSIRSSSLLHFICHCALFYLASLQAPLLAPFPFLLSYFPPVCFRFCFCLEFPSAVPLFILLLTLSFGFASPSISPACPFPWLVHSTGLSIPLACPLH